MYVLKYKDFHLITTCLLTLTALKHSPLHKGNCGMHMRLIPYVIHFIANVKPRSIIEYVDIRAPYCKKA